MNAQITVQGKTEFDFSKIRINSDYNIIIHCVYDPFSQFETEFAFLHALTANDLVILWHPVEQGHFEPVWMNKLDDMVASAPYKLVYLTGCGHKQNVNDQIPHKFDLRFFPVFDVRVKDMFPKVGLIKLDKKYAYMCLNAKDVAHRRYVLGTLIDAGLLEKGVLSYQCTEGISTSLTDFDHISSEQEQEKINKLLTLCDAHIPIILDGNTVAGAIDFGVFANTYLNIVGETHFVAVPYRINTSFVTEKTFTAIANNQMFIIVGHPGSLDLLKSLGYKTFDSIIDESYDTELNNTKRLFKVTEEIIRFISQPISKIKEDYIHVLDIIEHNRKLLFSTSLEQRLQELVNTL